MTPPRVGEKKVPRPGINPPHAKYGQQTKIPEWYRDPFYIKRSNQSNYTQVIKKKHEYARTAGYPRELGDPVECSGILSFFFRQIHNPLGGNYMYVLSVFFFFLSFFFLLFLVWFVSVPRFPSRVPARLLCKFNS